MDIAKERERDLVSAAIAVRERAYAPYSGFKVGAAVLGASGEIYVGAMSRTYHSGLRSARRESLSETP